MKLLTNYFSLFPAPQSVLLWSCANVSDFAPPHLPLKNRKLLKVSDFKTKPNAGYIILFDFFFKK